MGSASSYRSLSIKAAAASAAVASTAAMLHFAGPSILRFASSEIPKIYSSLLSWLTPPYLYFVINGIIISIAASSRLQIFARSDDLIGSGSESATAAKQEFAVAAVVAAPPPPEVRAEYGISEKVAEYAISEMAVERDDEFEIVRSSWEPKMREAVTAVTASVKERSTEYSFLSEKPLVSARLGRRKSLKATAEGGKALGVSRPKKHDTLESTWKAITDGRNVSRTRHLKKSDTWETHHHHPSARPSPDDPASPDPFMRKCETFNEHGGGAGGGARRPPKMAVPLATARLKRDPSMGQDELNRRAEAFIKKVNDEMRLQREESLQHYVDMINRGSH